VSVPPRISIVTLGVDDLKRSRAFYEALGWEVAGSVGDEICWFRTSDSYLGLFDRESLAKDAALRSEPRAEFGGITLAINVESEEAVSAALEAAVNAGGARVLKPGTRADWGGFSGYFADPDGHPWEVAFNPTFPIGDDGRIMIS
jgi:catechol 2,3-dioxygenase-like lactoylglutathione lyase family enzyme